MGRYRILARLGAGGMGRVYLGRSTSGRMVAVKVVRAELSEDPDFLRRFAREVEAARRVTGFFTAAVVDADPEGSPAWLATAYVPGLALDAAVQAHGAWPVRSLHHLGAGLVEALEAIHGTGLIHRDLKPSNVLLATDGPRVIDFGISLATESSVLTQTGMVIGTPGYMSPEQVTGHRIGPASDVFSLGAVLAFAGTGKSPFGIGSPHSVNFRAVYEDPDLSGLPEGADFVARCLEKDPERRPTVPELLAEFARLLGETGTHTLGGGLPRETDWLPAPVAAALTRPAAGHEAKDGAVEAGAGGSAGAGAVKTPPPSTPDPRDALAKRPEPAPPAQAPAADHPAPGPAPQPSVPATPVPATPAPAPPPLPRPVPPMPAQAPAPAPVPQQAPGPEGPDATWPPVAAQTSPVRPAAAPGSRTARTRRIVAIAVAAALVTGAGVTTAVLMNQGKGQGGDKNASGENGGSGTGVDKPGPTGFDAAVTGVVNPSTAKGGTLRLRAAYDADSWDTGRAYYGWVWNFQRLYARTLLTYDTKPGRAGTSLVPDLAEAQPEVSPDGKTYTVRLRSGLTFEDGSPIASTDVKYAIERTFDQEVLSGGPTYFVDALDPQRKYPGPAKDTTPGKKGLSTIETPDDRTLVFRLAKADSRFPHLLAMGATSPVPRAKDTGARYGTRPVASGPYKFSSYTPEEKLVLVRNPGWKQSTDPVRKALPDRIELTFTKNAEALTSDLLAGSADLDAQQSGLSQAAAARVLGDRTLRARADAPATGYVPLLALVSAVAPFDNVHCRKAVFYAADPKALQTARGGPTAGAPLGSLLPPTIPGSDAYDPYGLTAGKPRPEKAREELRACGRPQGFATKLAVRDNHTQQIATAEALRTSLKQVGITIEVEKLDISKFYETVGSPATVRNQGYGLLLAGWGADHPHGASFLQPLADSRSMIPSGNTDYAQVDDPAVDALFDRAAAETDPTKAAGLYRDINHKVTDGAYYLPIVAQKTLNYRNPRLTNVYVSQAYGMVDLQALGVGGA
ncbi:ABC transporter substrate-binding protein [Streptomyces sp. NPDC004787]|uniref:ABC transporter substrate-binding protein n=1 Tax=Streptomyces sp. NPDC004787 TaxID=3154291 RepID=UPI0033B13749